MPLIKGGDEKIPKGVAKRLRPATGESYFFTPSWGKGGICPESTEHAMSAFYCRSLYRVIEREGE